jgi:hypothetical protein
MSSGERADRVPGGKEKSLSLMPFGPDLGLAGASRPRAHRQLAGRRRPGSRTGGISYPETTTLIALTIAEDAKVDSGVTRDGDAFDQGCGEDGDQEQDKGKEEHHR